MNTNKLLWAALLFFTTYCLSAQTVFVESFGTGNGSSWSNATNLQTALQSATNGTEIWVKAGVYNPVNCNSCTQQQREISFEIPSGVRVYGGFAGTETTADQRNPVNNVTALSGDIDSDGTDNNNSNTVVLTTNVSAQTIIDGFTIRDGRADFSNSGDVTKRRRGGGWYNDGSQSGNNSNPTIRRCIIENNYAAGQGGGIYNDAIFDGHADPIIEDCIFRNNISNLGGAMYNNAREGNSSPQIIRCQFIGNEAFATGGAVYTFARESDGFANPAFINCLFRGNFASSCGGVYSLGAANGNVITEITNCTFSENHADVGGAVYVNASDGGDCEAKVYNCIFWGNYAGFDDVFHYSGSSGPVIRLRNSLVDIDNCDDLLQGSGSIDCQGGIIYNQDPLFANPTNFDFHLTETSPCINVGSNSDINATGQTIDLDGSFRIQEGTVDLGCFEFGSAVNLPLTITQQPQNQAGCAGQSATFSFNATGTQPLTYQWQKNNVNLTGETSNNLTINNLAVSDAAVYHCIVTDANGENLSGQNANLTVNPTVVPTVSITADDLNVCNTEGITFTASSTNGGASGSPFYIWQVNGSNVENQNTETFVLENGTENDAVLVTMISTATCAIPSSAQSQILIVTAVSNTPPPSIIITANADEICLGETVVFASDVINGGTNPTYTWRINGTPVAMNSTYSTDQLTANDVVTCEVSIINDCGETLSETSESITVNIQTIDAPQVSIQSSTMQICQGGTVVFTPTVVNAGVSQTYIWRVNGQIVSDTETYSTDQLLPGNNVICEVTVIDECGVSTTTTSNSSTISVQIPTTPQITIQTSNTTQCAGENLTFSAIVQNAGDSPVYDWRVNNISVADSNEFNTNTLADSDLVTCVLVSSQTCITASFVTSNAIEMTIFPIANPEIIITASGTEVCQNGNVTFTANITDGGDNPIITWFVNGTQFATNETNFTVENLTTFTSVQAQIETDAPCTTSLFAFSETISIEIIEGILPTVNIATDATEYCETEDMMAVFTASANFPPLSYIWSVNGSEVQNSASNSLTLTDFSTGDIVDCHTISEGECLTSEEADSEGIELTVFALPTVSITPFDTICTNENLLVLETGSPFGGEYSGDFVESNTFNPMTAGVGLHTITYSFTDENGCANLAEEEIEVVLCTDVNEVQNIDFQAFPNPFTHTLRVLATNISEIEMRNVEGKLMQVETQIDSDNAVVYSGNLAAGVYFLRVVTAEGVGVMVLVKE